MARHRLDLEPELDLIVIGISSHVNDYRLCWALNKHLNVALSRRGSDITNGAGGAFTVYDHTYEESGARLSLISNRSEGRLLLKDQKQADFFLVMDEAGPLRAEELLERVRNMDLVLAVFNIDPKRIRSAPELLA